MIRKALATILYVYVYIYIYISICLHVYILYVYVHIYYIYMSTYFMCMYIYIIHRYIHVYIRTRDDGAGEGGDDLPQRLQSPEEPQHSERSHQPERADLLRRDDEDDVCGAC